MSRITVVGASGYIGGRIALKLQHDGHEVIGTFRRRPNDPEKNLSALSGIIQGDITDNNFLDMIVDTKPHVLVYLVSLNHHATEENYQYSVNVNLAPLMELARKLATKEGFNRLIFMSTLQVYGKLSTNKMVMETDQIAPANMYGWTHAACEYGLELLNRTHNLKSTSLRLSNGYGAPAFPSCDCWWLVLNDFCRSAMRDGKIQLQSDGSPQRDFIHVNNIAEIISAVVKNKDEVPQIMNLASGRSLSMLELAHIVSDVFEADFGRYVPVVLPDGSISTVPRVPDQRLKVSIEAVSQLIPSLQFDPLKSGIIEIIQYILDFNLYKV